MTSYISDELFDSLEGDIIETPGVMSDELFDSLEGDIIETPEDTAPEDTAPAGVMSDELFDSLEGDIISTTIGLPTGKKLLPTKDLSYLYTDIPDEVEIKADFFESPNVQKSISMFLEDYQGEKGAREHDESKQEYAERFFKEMRWMENNLVSTGSGIGWLRQTSDTQKANFGALYTAFTDMPAFYEEGGGGSWSAVQDHVASAIWDVTNVATLGAGFGLKLVGGRMAARTLLSQAIKSNVGKITGAVVAEGMLGALQEAEVQSLQQEANLREEKDWVTITAMGALNATVSGGLNIAALKKGANDASYKDKLADKLAEIKVEPADGSVAAKAAPVYGRSYEDELANTPTIFDAALNHANKGNAGGTPASEGFDEAAGRAALDELSPPEGITSGRITIEVLGEAKALAGKLMDAVPEFRPSDDETISDAMYRMFDTVFQEEDIDALERTVRSSGIDVEELGHAAKVLSDTLKSAGVDMNTLNYTIGMSTKEAARHMAMLSHLKRAQNKLAQIDPQAMKFLDDASAEDVKSASYFQRFHGGAMKADRIRRSIMTSQPSTTARNIASATGYVTFDTASKILQESFMGISRAIRATVEGRASVEGTKIGIRDTFLNAFGLVASLANNGMSREISELILKDNDRLSHILLRTTQEAGTEQLPKAVMALNALNIAQDQFMRSGVFVTSIERKMKAVGLDMMETLAAKKQIPLSIVKESVDEALQATFADVPKGTHAHSFIRIVENLPFAPVVGTGEFPFARFMVSAMHFQHRYGPTSFMGNAFRLTQAKFADARGKGNPVKTAKAAKAMADSSVGTAALMAAIYYRKNNQDISYNEYKQEDGSVADITAYFPLPYYLVVADVLVKAEEGTMSRIDFKDMLQGLSGMQLKPARVDWFMEGMKDAIIDGASGVDGASGEKVADNVGRFLGTTMGQYMTPAKVVRDVVSAFDAEQAIIRDPNQIKSKGFVSRFGESMSNNAIKDLPWLSNDLPGARRASKEGDIYRHSPMVTQLTGFKADTIRTKVETELVRNGIKLWGIGPKTGDKEADAIIRGKMPFMLNAIMTPLIESDHYKNLSVANKRIALKKQLVIVKEQATLAAEGGMYDVRKDRGYSPAMRGRWSRVNKDLRRAANEMYMKTYGSSIDEDRAYEYGLSLVAEIKAR